jgi:hypothetical protein
MKFGTTIPLYYAAATTTAIAGILHLIVVSKQPTIRIHII